MLRCIVINCLESKIIIIHVKYKNSIFDGKMTNRSSYTLPCEMHHIRLLLHVGLKMLLHLLQELIVVGKIRENFQNSFNKSKGTWNEQKKNKKKGQTFHHQWKGYLLHSNFQQFVFIYRNCKEKLLELCVVFLFEYQKKLNQVLTHHCSWKIIKIWHYHFKHNTTWMLHNTIKTN